MTLGFDDVRRVADDELLARLERLVKADRALSVKLLVHLGEVEARKLFLERGYSSMYSYCMTALGMSEAETYLRLLAAKTGKRFPLVLERLSDGGLHLTAVKLLAPLLTEANHVALLDRARGMSKRQLEVLVAELAPQPDVPERVRKLPEPRESSSVAARRAPNLPPSGAFQFRAGAATVGAAVGGGGISGGGAVVVVGSDRDAVVSGAAYGGELSGGEVVVRGAAADGGVFQVAAGPGCEVSSAIAVDSNASSFSGTAAAPLHVSTAAAAASFVLQSPPVRSSISPLSPGRFKLELTLGQEAYDQLEQLRELFRHQNPSGEITCIVERALGELLERTLKRRFAQGGSPRLSNRRHSGGALDGVAERTGCASDADETRPVCSTEDRACRDDAHCDAFLAAGQQAPGAGGAERKPDAADADELQADGLSGDLARDAVTQIDASPGVGRRPFGDNDSAHRDASLAAGHLPPHGRRSMLRVAGGDVGRAPRAAGHSRYVPRRVLREVYARDAGQCSYVSGDGRRCSARGFLEVHHHEAFARGGAATVDNLRLTCRAHNIWLAEREMGAGFHAEQVARC
jgi:hypothetical protein